MAYQSFDTAEVLTGHAWQLQRAGFTSVGVYMRTDRTPEIEIQGLHIAGIKKFSIYEKGFATTPGHFTVNQGEIDGPAALDWAGLVTQPVGTPMFFCADYDATWQQILPYIKVVHDIIKPKGYLMGLYTGGRCILDGLNAGYVHYGYLSQSQGFPGYTDYLHRADIVQGPSGTVSVLGASFGVDWDTVRNPAVTW